VGRASCQTLICGHGSEKPRVPQGVWGGSTMSVVFARHGDAGGKLSAFPPTIKNYARTDANKGNPTV